jgi:hypothetical protein
VPGAALRWSCLSVGASSGLAAVPGVALLWSCWSVGGLQGLLLQ